MREWRTNVAQAESCKCREGERLRGGLNSKLSTVRTPVLPPAPSLVCTHTQDLACKGSQKIVHSADYQSLLTWLLLRAREFVTNVSRVRSDSAKLRGVDGK
eukprot:TRINITY_DN4568_c0_g1_i1.p1 TRINITY_DN4568_c0_g1~~TRINITY_DN4568_c0_g1_i1.p1  ORF type:complete len:101 (+),score=4.06 TRINITY_DN4568_c0_g1_i1:67-369(+)